MADTAAHLVDAVLPRVPVRQWVLSMPKQARYWLARDSKLLGRAERIFVEEISRGTARRVACPPKPSQDAQIPESRRRRGLKRIRDGRYGAVTAVQRFGSALNLNVHFHTLALDGVYLANGAGGAVSFRRLRAPEPEELGSVLDRVRRRIGRMLVQEGMVLGEESRGEEPSAFDVMQAASIREWIGLSGVARKVPYVGGSDEATTMPRLPELCVAVDGWSLHANVRIRAGDRAGLEKLCRYLLRPALAGERLEWLSDGRVSYAFRKPRMDGATHLVLKPVELIEKLAALVAPPRSHLVRYHGVLAARSRVRREIAPRRGEESLRDRARCGQEEPTSGRRRDGSGGRRRSRTDWATLMRRSFGMDVLACPKCGARMRVIACVTKRSAVRAILESLEMEDEAAGLGPARSPPEAAGDSFEVDQSSEF